MKAYYYDAASYGKKFRSEAIPEELQSEVQRWREHLFEVLTRHDDGDKLTSHDRPDHCEVSFNTLAGNQSNIVMSGRSNGLGATALLGLAGRRWLRRRYGRASGSTSV